MENRKGFIRTVIIAAALVIAANIAVSFTGGGAGTLIMNFGLLALIIVFAIYDHKRSKQIRGLTDDMARINSGDYDTNIADNSEDELSILRNELYKTCVHLRESAENAEGDRVALKNSVEDIAHQLKTPMTSINITLDNLTENPDIPEETRKEFLNDIRRELRHINYMTNVLLKLGQLEANTVTFREEPVKLGDIVAAAVANTEILAELKSVECEVKGEAEDELMLDSTWQTEAVTNILKNAIEHSPEGSVIMIEMTDKKLACELKITDKGPGIPQDEVGHIFERFYTRSGASGTGIGLVLAKSIIDAQGGFISVTSSDGEGTTFKINYFKKGAKK